MVWSLQFVQLLKLHSLTAMMRDEGQQTWLPDPRLKSGHRNCHSVHQHSQLIVVNHQMHHLLTLAGRPPMRVPPYLRT